jgi:hypothetical protein
MGQVYYRMVNFGKGIIVHEAMPKSLRENDQHEQADIKRKCPAKPKPFI